MVKWICLQSLGARQVPNGAVQEGTGRPTSSGDLRLTARFLILCCSIYSPVNVPLETPSPCRIRGRINQVHLSRVCFSAEGAVVEEHLGEYIFFNFSLNAPGLRIFVVDTRGLTTQKNEHSFLIPYPQKLERSNRKNKTFPPNSLKISSRASFMQSGGQSFRRRVSRSHL